MISLQFTFPLCLFEESHHGPTNARPTAVSPRENAHQGTGSSLGAHQREVHTREGINLIDNLDSPCRRYTARIDTVTAKRVSTFTPTSADTRTVAVEYPRGPFSLSTMDWRTDPPPETQPHPRPLQPRRPTKAISLHQPNSYCRELTARGPC